MFNQYEVPAYLVDKLPEIEKDLKMTYPNLNIFKTVQCLAAYTKTMVKQHDLGMVKKCFAAADALYSKGNQLVRNAVENVFVYSFTGLMNMGSADDRRKLQAMMPLDLHTAYVQQVLKSGI